MLNIKRIILCIAAGLCFWSIVTEASTETQSNNGNSLAHHLNTVQDSLEVLSRSIRSAHSDLLERQLEACQFMGPMSDSICSLFNLDKTMETNNLLGRVIHGPYAPGKRSEGNFEEIDRRKRLIEDLYRKEKLLERLKSVIEEAQDSMQQERKRSCNLNLGFHCKTEQYSQIADMYNWLQSSMSPGRRKRSTRNEKLISD